MKVGRKRRAFQFSLILSSCSHSFPKNEKDTEKIEKWSFFLPISPPAERKKFGNWKEENTYPQGHGKEKDLASSFDETRSKTMRFYSGKTSNVFAPEKAIWFCWDIVRWPCAFIIHDFEMFVKKSCLEKLTYSTVLWALNVCQPESDSPDFNARSRPRGY